MTVRIVTDSSCDLPARVITNYGICVVPLYINVGSQSYLDDIDMTRDEFYKRLPSFSKQPTTAVPSPQKFRRCMTRLRMKARLQFYPFTSPVP